MTNETILSRAQAIADEILTHRRWLHAHAETGFHIANTKDYVKTALEQMGYQVTECGKAGLVTTIGQGERTILLRADMDALPITEEADVDFSCTNGRMHACGHDMHTAMLLGAAKLLKKHEHSLKGTVKLMFQPAEEIFEGAKDMIHDGLLENPKVDMAMMIHVAAGLPIPAGTAIVSTPGVTAPAADYFSIRIQGVGCHGSTPQKGIDPLTAAAHVLIALQEIHARELDPAENAVLTIGTFHGGSAENVIADHATLGGTIRTYDETTRNYLKDRITQIATGIAASFRASAQVEFGSGCPTLVNDETVCNHVLGYLKEILGPSGAINAADFNRNVRIPSGGGSEDFAYISHLVPSVMIVLAAGDPALGYVHSQHHPKVRFDETVLPIGAAAFAHIALRYLGAKEEPEDYSFKIFRQ